MQKAHLQVTGSEGASGIQTEDFKVEVQELGGGAGKQRIREKKMREKLKPLHAEPALGATLRRGSGITSGWPTIWEFIA